MVERAPCGAWGLTLLLAALALTLPPCQATTKVNMKEAIGVSLKNKTLVLVGIGGGLPTSRSAASWPGCPCI